MSILDYFLGKKVPQISVEEAHRRLQAEEPPVIVDVRQPVETGSGTVANAVLIPLTDLGQRLDELPKGRPILTICRSSHRSPMAAKRLRKAGFEVTDVAGGMQAWESAGLPTTDDNQ